MNIFNSPIAEGDSGGGGQAGEDVQPGCSKNIKIWIERS